MVCLSRTLGRDHTALTESCPPRSGRRLIYCLSPRPVSIRPSSRIPIQPFRIDPDNIRRIYPDNIRIISGYQVICTRQPESRSTSTGVSVRQHGLPPRTPTSAAGCASPRIPKKGLTTELIHSPETRSNRFLTERSSEIDCYTCMHALSRTCSSQTSRAYLTRGDDTMTRHNLEY